MAQRSQEAGQYLCKVFGLDPNQVVSITVVCAANDALQVSAELTPNADLSAVGDNVKATGALVMISDSKRAPDEDGVIDMTSLGDDTVRSGRAN